VNTLGLEEVDSLELSRYISELKRSQIRLRNREYELIWAVDPLGSYSPKAGYVVLSTYILQRDIVWWCKKLCKLNFPPNTCLFMWNVLENKVPTWDNLQKRNKHDPGWCVL